MLKFGDSDSRIDRFWCCDSEGGELGVGEGFAQDSWVRFGCTKRACRDLIPPEGFRQAYTCSRCELVVIREYGVVERSPALGRKFTRFVTSRLVGSSSNLKIHATLSQSY
jgi:hypothetical protein